MTQTDIAEILGVSHQRVGVLEKRAKDKYGD